MSQSIKQRLSKFEAGQAYELRILLEAALADIVKLRADLVALKAASEANTTALDTALDVLIAKMNLDAGITDANYAASLTAMTATTLTSTTASLAG